MSKMKNDIWADIERLSELKSNYNCFDEKEEPYYRALSNAIQALRLVKTFYTIEEVFGDDDLES